MDSHEDDLGFAPAGSQQTKLSGFFRNVHSKFSGLLPLSKKEVKVEDVVIASQIVRKKSPLVIGNFAHNVAAPEVDRPTVSFPLNGSATPPLSTPLSAPVWSNEHELDPKKGFPIIQVVQAGERDSILSPQSSHDTIVDHSNGDAFKEPNSGVGTKRKATEAEDEVNKRIDARILGVSISTNYSNAYRNTKSALRKELEYSILRGIEEEIVKPKAPAKRVTWELDKSFDLHKVSNNLESLVEDVITQPNRNRVQAPPTTSIPASDNSLLDGPLCQLKEIRVGYDAVRKELPFNNSSVKFPGLADEIDSENCSTSGMRQKKDVDLVDKWSLPVDVQGDLFSCKLKEILSKPLDHNEFSEMWELATRRKPILKLRQTRGRTMHVTTDDEGLSYLDHHPDLAQRLEESPAQLDKLTLLRGFFFWLQHSCMEGAYKPWAPASKKDTEEGDCEITDGLDCEVLAVVLPLDEKKDVSSVVKPLVPVLVDLSDDDEDDCVEMSAKLPEKAVSKPSFQRPATCNCCVKEFGMGKDQQRALYKTCGHIETCMGCVDKFWMVGKHDCLKCGVIQSMRPRSIMDFADSD